MNTLRIVLSSLVLSVAVSAGAQADTATTAATASGAPATGHRWHGGSHAGFGHVLGKLNLTADQKTQIKSIFAQTKPQFDALRASIRANREALASTAPTDHPAYDTLLATAKANAASRTQLQSDVWGQVYAVLSHEQQSQIPGILAEEKAARAARIAAWRSQHGQT